MFVSKLQQDNKNIREILLDILNEMSSAVNGFWNFQIVEGESEDGSIILTVVDENWIGENPDETSIISFRHNGIDSPFLNSTLDIAIPSEMANQIIMKRLGYESQKDMAYVSIDTGSFFNSDTDLFMKRVTQTDTVPDTDENTTTTEDNKVSSNRKLIEDEEAKIDNSKTERQFIDSNKDKYNLIYTDTDGNVIKRELFDGRVVYPNLNHSND